MSINSTVIQLNPDEQLLYKAPFEKGLVSVIIPTYNHAKFIRDAIQSVLSQIYPHYEIIVVDDGSKDDTKGVVAEFSKRVSYIWQENQGLSAARNTGIRASKGEFIGVLDADDMYEPDFLNRMVAALRNDPEAGGCYCGFQFADARNNPLPQYGDRVVAHEYLYMALLDGNFLVPECILVRSSVYQRVGLFDETLTACEDWDMWLRISRSYKVTGTGDFLVRHRILPGSMSSDPIRMLTNRIAVLEKVFGKSVDPFAEQCLTRQRAFGRAYLATAYEYLQNWQPVKASECLRKATHDCPDLLREFDVYYELGCGAQPKGWRGDFATLDIQQNANLLFSILENLFNDRELYLIIKTYQRDAYANAFLALGLLSYGSHQFPLARRYLFQALKRQPLYLFKKHFILTFLKTLLGQKVISRFHHSFQKS